MTDPIPAALGADPTIPPAPSGPTPRSRLHYPWPDATHAWWPQGPDGIAVPVIPIAWGLLTTDITNIEGDVHDVPTIQLTTLEP